MALISQTSKGDVSYLPSQVQQLSAASKKASLQSPIRLFLRDTVVLFRLLRYLPWLFIPIKTTGKDGEYTAERTSSVEKSLQIALFIIEALFVVVAIPAFVILPGLIFLGLMGVVLLLIQLLSYPLSGPSPILSNSTAEARQKHASEKWVFLNGCASGHRTLQKDINCLSHVFGREVIGIHNKSFGLVADILECLVQRCFGYRTTDVRVAYEQIKTLLLDADIKKIVLIGHSQGGITISLVVDELLAELPQQLLAKLEIYTFGSAASHLNNPPVAVESKTRRGLTISEPKLLIPHIEHYANEYDMVPRWGVLNSTQSILTQQYAGQVFVHKTSGHMFVQHYISAIFSSADPNAYLDQIVKLDEASTDRSDSIETLSVESRKHTGLEFGSGERVLDAAEDGEDMFSFDRTASGRLQLLEARGKTVRELSRLWKYQGGKSPEDA